MLVRALSGNGGSGSGGKYIHKQSVSLPQGTSTITIDELTNIDAVCWQLNTNTKGNDDNFFGACMPSLYSGYLIPQSSYMHTLPSQYGNSGVRSFSGNQITFYWGSVTTIDLWVMGT